MVHLPGILLEMSLPAKKIGMTELLEIVVYPFGMAFDIDLFTSHMLHRTAHVFAAHGEVERCFVAVGEIDFETQQPPSTMSIIVPKWELAARDRIYADVREYLVKAKAIAVASTSEDEDSLKIVIEWKRHRQAFAAMKIGDTIALWQRVSAGVAIPLLPVARDDLQ